MLKHFGVAAAVVALSVSLAAPASAQFGRLGRALKDAAREAVAVGSGTQNANSPSSGSEGEAPSRFHNQKLSKLPAEFARPFPPISDPDLSEANIRELMERDFAGVAKVLKVAAERESGPLWTARKTTDGEIISMWASLLIHSYVQLKDGTCAVYLTGTVIEKPSLGFGNGFGEAMADDNPGQEYLNQPCNLN